MSKGWVSGQKIGTRALGVWSKEVITLREVSVKRFDCIVSQPRFFVLIRQPVLDLVKQASSSTQVNMTPYI